MDVWVVLAVWRGQTEEVQNTEILKLLKYEPCKVEADNIFLTWLQKNDEQIPATLHDRDEWGENPWSLWRVKVKKMNLD